MKNAALLATILSASVAGCAHTQPVPAAVAPVDAEGHGPPPFSAEQIRDASSKGRTYVFRMETTGEPTTILRMEFVRVAPDQVTIRRTVATESGEILNGPTDLTSTWTELRSHALWPAKDMSITEDTVEVPAGRFDALLYDVRELSEEGPMRTKAWFAKSLPGAPVLMKVDVEGGPSSTMTLVEHVAGE